MPIRSGLANPLPMSAEHGEGIDDLYEALKPHVGTEPKTRKRPRMTQPLKLAIIGQPNSGKSTLINALIGEERMLTGPEAGITRDAIAIDWGVEGQTDQALGYRRHPAQIAGHRQGREARGRRRASRHSFRRRGDRADRRLNRNRAAGSDARQPRCGRGKGGGHRPQQMGHSSRTSSSA